MEDTQKFDMLEDHIENANFHVKISNKELIKTKELREGSGNFYCKLIIYLMIMFVAFLYVIL